MRKPFSRSPKNDADAAWVTGPKKHQPQTFLNASPAQPLLHTAKKTALAARKSMVAQLEKMGISNTSVLQAMLTVPRHLFVDTALGNRAYENAALSIGHQQTISQPWVVARMVSLLLDAVPQPQICLEIGTGCGYQAAVLAQCCTHVCSIERIEHLYTQALTHMQHCQLSNVQLLHADGMQGWPGSVVVPIPRFDVIIVAAAGINIAPAWLAQLKVGGRLVAPVQLSSGKQHLLTIDRVGDEQFEKNIYETVQFVPLLAGTKHAA